MPKERIKTTSTHPPHRYSAEQVISSLMEDSSLGLDSDDSNTNSEKSEKNHISSSLSNVFNNKSFTPETSNDKEYTKLKPLRSDTPSPPPVNLETQFDSSYPPSSDPSSHSIYSSTHS